LTNRIRRTQGRTALAMSAHNFSFEVLASDARSAARSSVFYTPHGRVEMPAFMPVGTQATVKGVSIDALRATGAQMVLANTYHLALRPGAELVRDLGGLHAFCGWSGPMLTDSGGFQIFSLAQSTKITEQHAVFRSHIDGTLFELSPERAVAIQEALGADVAMVLDQVVALPAAEAAVREACARSARWARRCLEARSRGDQALFGIVQGGLDAALRVECAGQLGELPFEGFAVGGLSVGEPPAEMYRILTATVPAMPRDKPRYLMGVGRPQDILEAVRRGIDLFDCVLPTRNGRNALAFTAAGPVRLRNRQYERDEQPLEEDCPCPACRHSRAYLRHLFMVNEMLGPVLVSQHNLTYYQRLMAGARAAIGRGDYSSWADGQLASLVAGESEGEG